MRNSSEADFKFIDSVAARWWVISALFFSCALLGWTWLSPPISNDLWRILIASRWAGFQVVWEETLFELPRVWNWKLAKLALEFVALLGKNVFKRIFSAFFRPNPPPSAQQLSSRSGWIFVNLAKCVPTFFLLPKNSQHFTNLHSPSSNLKYSNFFSSKVTSGGPEKFWWEKKESHEIPNLNMLR